MNQRDVLKRTLRRLAFLLPLLLLTACAAVNTPKLDYRAGAVVETLASSVSLSAHTSESSMGGNGYMVFRRPDLLHLVILSPFGTTLMEAFAAGDRITLLYPTKMTAYSGRFYELPEKGGLQGWSMMRWVMDSEPHADRSRNETVERVGKLGFIEKVSFENGLVTSKSSPSGDHVYYGRYSLIEGVPLAAEVEITNAREDRIRIVLNEPEVNTPLDDTVFKPKLDGFTILPLTDLK